VKLTAHFHLEPKLRKRGAILLLLHTFSCKGKGKVVPALLLTEHHAVKAYWGSGGIAPRILLPWH
jgi:hypothetical protein